MPHRSLYEMLWTMNYYDVALEHLRAEVDILRRQRGRELEARERLLEENEREVEMLRRYAQSTKAQSAESLLQPFGLAGEAMTQGRQGKATAQDHEIYLYLLLTTGRIEELDAALHDNPALPKLLGTRFHRYEGLLAAARGNYQEADQHFKESIQLLTYRQSLMELLQSRTIDGTMPLLGRLAMAPHFAAASHRFRQEPDQPGARGSRAELAARPGRPGNGRRCRRRRPVPLVPRRGRQRFALRAGGAARTWS